MGSPGKDRDIVVSRGVCPPHDQNRTPTPLEAVCLKSGKMDEAHTLNRWPEILIFQSPAASPESIQAPDFQASPRASRSHHLFSSKAMASTTFASTSFLVLALLIITPHFVAATPFFCLEELEYGACGNAPQNKVAHNGKVNPLWRPLRSSIIDWRKILTLFWPDIQN